MNLEILGLGRTTTGIIQDAVKANLTAENVRALAFQEKKM